MVQEAAWPKSEVCRAFTIWEAPVWPNLSALNWTADCRYSEENLPITSLVDDFYEIEMIERKPSSYPITTLASWLKEVRLEMYKVLMFQACAFVFCVWLAPGCHT